MKSVRTGTSIAAEQNWAISIDFVLNGKFQGILHFVPMRREKIKNDTDKQIQIS
jgi:hypothetical protein